VIATVIFLIGLFLWWNDRAVAGSMSALGSSVLGGAVVAFVVLAFQLFADTQREQLAEESSLRATISLQRDLTGTDLSGRDLSGIHLKGKNFTDANFSDAMLDNANLECHLC
jgi:uncharacterized protein YjbI with pentapeptide repeats